jgi:pimeloyl-ACP methyl ester carboxylesterase
MSVLSMVERATRRALNASGFESRWVETRIARQHFYDAKGRGDLPPVVVLHGINSAATPFGPLIQSLRPKVRRVLALDAPAHGFSSPPKVPLTLTAYFEGIRELLDRELHEPAILVGNSLGGGMALKYALNRPERVCGLFLASPAGASMDPEAFKRFLLTFRLESKEEALAFIRRLYHKTPWFAPLIAGDVKLLFAREAIQLLTSAATVGDLFTAEQLSELTVPAHLLWGRSDRLMPPESLLFFKRSLPPHATIEEPEGFGHCPHLDAPRRFAKKILEFAQGVVKATRRARGSASPTEPRAGA